MTASIPSAKASLRARIQASLRSLTPSEIDAQSSIVHAALFTRPEYQAARNVSVFLSMPAGEVSTGAIVRHALDQGKRVFVPYLYRNEGMGSGGMEGERSQPKMLMDMVLLRSREDYEALKPDRWGIPSLQPAQVLGRERCLGEEIGSVERQGSLELDLVVMPGVGFDRGLRRLGHGKGFYDFFLARYQAQTNGAASRKIPFLVGIALEQQVLPDGEEVPVSSTDWPLDALIVGDGSVFVSRKDISPLKAPNP